MKDKKINFLSLAFTFAGCFLGAGYVSGQELWQFFGSFGVKGLAGVAGAVLMLAVMGIMLIRVAGMKQTGEMDSVVSVTGRPAGKMIFSITEIFFLFGIAVVMTAGAGSLLGSIFGIPERAGNVIFALIVAGISLAGLRGMVSAFSVSVPLMAVISLGVFVYLYAFAPERNFDMGTVTNTNPLISNIFISAPVFASYNLFASIGILTPIEKHIGSRKTLYAGIALGSVLLTVIAYAVLLSMAMDSASVTEELPMLRVAADVSPVLRYVFAVLLFAGMLGTAVSSVFAIIEYIREKLRPGKHFTAGAVFSVSVLMTAASLAGFSTLVSTVYPVCGYLGFAGIILIIVNYITRTVRQHEK